MNYISRKYSRDNYKKYDDFLQDLTFKISNLINDFKNHPLAIP